MKEVKGLFPDRIVHRPNSVLKGVPQMEEVRCLCGKLLCKVENNRVVIKCRHCKRFIVIEVGDGEIVARTENGDPVEFSHLFMDDHFKVETPC